MREAGGCVIGTPMRVVQRLKEIITRLGVAQVQQIQMLRQLVMAEMNSQNTAAANQLNSQTQSQLGALAIIGGPPSLGVAGVYQPSAQPPPQ
jgi:hypothetical protein